MVGESRRVIKSLFLILLLVFPTSAQTCNTNYIELGNIVRGMGWIVTSEMGGGHNSHSKHYIGKAIDVRVWEIQKGKKVWKTQFEIDLLTMIMNQNGYIVRDERKRPKGQRIWKGAHIHIEIPYCLG